MKKGTAIFPGWLFPFVYCVAGVDAYFPFFKFRFAKPFFSFIRLNFCVGGTPLFPDKQKAGIAPGICMNIHFSTRFWSNRIKILAA